MSTREKFNTLATLIPDDKLASAYFMLLKYLHDLEEEEDDAYCAALYDAFLDNPDPEKYEGTPIEELAAQWGISLE